MGKGARGEKREGKCRGVVLTLDVTSELLISCFESRNWLQFHGELNNFERIVEIRITFPLQLGDIFGILCPCCRLFSCQRAYARG